MIIKHPTISKQDFENGTGWELKTEGACRGAECIPLPAGLAEDDPVRVEPLAEALQLPLVQDPKRGLWAIGPSSRGGRALTDTQADFTLPTLEGKAFDLSSLRGKKVLVYAWAPY